MPTTDYSQTTRTKNLAAKEISKFHLLNPSVHQGGRYNFAESSRLLQGLGDVVIRIAASTRRRLPDVPTEVSAVGGDGEATISFTPPVNDGGSPIISYTVISSPGGFTASSSSSPITVLGLTNGILYTFSLVATNAVGNSTSASATATPGRAPDAPTGVSAVGGNSQATVSFTAPLNNGGSPIISYTVTTSPDGFTATSSSSPITLFGLTNGTLYTFSVVATNAIGNSASASTTATPATVPNPPTGVAAAGGNKNATISFTPPVNNGGSAIISYTVTSSPGGFTATSSSSPITVTGLSNGTSYTFSVVATNAVGNSTSVSASATTYTIPDPPTSVSAVGGNGQATISFTPPVDNGGSAIISYTVTSSPGGFTASGSSSPITVTGLTNGTLYTFSVVATNAIGNSTSESTSATPVSVPGAPTSVSAVGGNGQVTISFTPPVNNGGSPILSYTVTTSPGGFTASDSSSPITVTGLTNGTLYTFSVVATNEIGNSTSASTTARPATIPDAPTGVSAVAGNQQAIVSFTPPVNNGGSAIISYTVTSSPGGVTATGSSSPIAVSSLTNGTPYTFTVIATNSIGNSSASSSSSSVTPVFVDNIIASLTTSLTAYNNASDEDWVNITLTEYNTLQTNITGSTDVGVSDGYMMTATSSGLANNNSALVANSVTSASPAIPANSYLYAFSVMWRVNPGVGLRVYTNTSTSSTAGFNQVGNALPTITTTGISYYVRKGVSATNGATAGLLGCFTGTKMDYPNGSFPGSAGYIGFKILQSTGITPIPNMRYLLGDGSVPASNSTLSGNLGGYGAFGIQGLTTTTKQWA